VVDGVDDREPKGLWREEVVLLAEPVELRVAVEHAGRDELVEDADDKRREDRKDDVVQRERPRLVGDLARKVVEERVLTRQWT
jgi:hypothetical protein